ncbi:hypothetical protein ENSA5_11040 [Enhygromyxa salina]|uniref:Uncharacterized protein n=1 Tax=Enhygromyxa salina TaxID=215803 RepID=A0A2S9YGA8_9BACT|nr:hypothetical protein [Enhygromyxa salina]PRQ04056.1 hypothetical protein ENSA5_11040 [Enhygromyxa salina]
MNRSHTTLTLQAAALVIAFIAGAAPACVSETPPPGHCANEQGDATCLALDPTTPFCDGCGSAVAGCVAERPAVAGKDHCTQAEDPDAYLLAASTITEPRPLLRTARIIAWSNLTRGKAVRGAAQ